MCIVIAPWNQWINMLISTTTQWISMLISTTYPKIVLLISKNFLFSWKKDIVLWNFVFHVRYWTACSAATPWRRCRTCPGRGRGGLAKARLWHDRQTSSSPCRFDRRQSEINRILTSVNKLWSTTFKNRPIFFKINFRDFRTGERYHINDFLLNMPILPLTVDRKVGAI